MATVALHSSFYNPLRRRQKRSKMAITSFQLKFLFHDWTLLSSKQYKTNNASTIHKYQQLENQPVATSLKGCHSSSSYQLAVSKKSTTNHCTTTKIINDEMMWKQAMATGTVLVRVIRRN